VLVHDPRPQTIILPTTPIPLPPPPPPLPPDPVSPVLPQPTTPPCLLTPLLPAQPPPAPLITPPQRAPQRSPRLFASAVVSLSPLSSVSGQLTLAPVAGATGFSFVASLPCATSVWPLPFPPTSPRVSSPQIFSSSNRTSSPPPSFSGPTNPSSSLQTFLASSQFSRPRPIQAHLLNLFSRLHNFSLNGQSPIFYRLFQRLLLFLLCRTRLNCPITILACRLGRLSPLVSPLLLQHPSRLLFCPRGQRVPSPRPLL
jgi:hypothetical protein